MGQIIERVGKKGTTFTARVRLKGHPTVAQTFKRKSEAKNWLKVTEAAMLEGRSFKTVEARRRTVSDLVKRYVEQVAPTKKDSENRRRHLEWWAEELGGLCLSDMTPARIAEARDKLGQGVTHYGQKRSPSTVCLYLASLSHACTMAVREWGWLETNPVKRVTRPQKPRGRVRFLTEDELGRLMGACAASTNPQLSTVVTVALATGMRKAEVLGLTWEAVDFERSRVTLTHTKNGEVRVVPVAPHALKALKEHKRVRRRGSDLVFPGGTTKEGKIKPMRLQWAWRKALEAAEIENFTFHDLRHTTASYLAMNGATMREIADVLGHKTMAMVKRYTHLSEAHTASVVNAMADRFL